MRSIAVHAFLLVLTSLFGADRLGADTIRFVGVPTYVNDGAYYVTPYEVTINGVSQLVTCYDTHDDVNFGDTWQANLLTLNQAAATGYFAGVNSLLNYEKVAWLEAQQYSTPARQIGLQHAIWQVFGSAPTTPDSATYSAAANAAAATAFQGFDLSEFRFIEQIGGIAGHAGTEQALTFFHSQTHPEATASSITGSTSFESTSAVSPVPEPGSFSLWFCGVTLAGVWHNVSRSRRTRAADGCGEKKLRSGEKLIGRLDDSAA